MHSLNRFYFLLLIHLLPICVLAQIAEKLYNEDFAKVGLELSSDILFVENTTLPNLFEYLPSRSYNLGLTYNFYQRNNTNIKLSGIASFFTIKEFEPSLLSDGRVNRGFSDGDINTLIRLPLEIEHFFQLTNSSYFSLFTGVELMYNTHGIDEGYVLFNQNVQESNSIKTISIHEYARARAIPLYMGVNFGMTYSLPTRAVLLQFNLKYHFFPNDYIYQAVIVTSVNEVQQFSKHNITGSYFGFGIRITPNKFWFK